MLYEEQDNQLTFLPISTNCDNYVAQQNSLIEFRQSLTLLECKFLRAIIMQIKPGDDHFEAYSFSVKELASLFGNEKSIDNLYHRGEALTKSIMKKQFELRDKETGSWIARQWVESCEYNAKTSRFTVRLNDNLLPYLTGLGGKMSPFNQYTYKQIKDMTSYTAIRVFELLTRHINGGESDKESLDAGGYKIRLTKQQIIDACMLYKKDENGEFITVKDGRKQPSRYVPAYDRTSQFKARIIKNACDVITKHSDWYVPYNENDLDPGIDPETSVRFNGRDLTVKELMRVDDVKEGHSVVAFDFYINLKSNIKKYFRNRVTLAGMAAS